MTVFRPDIKYSEAISHSGIEILTKTLRLLKLKPKFIWLPEFTWWSNFDPFESRSKKQGKIIDAIIFAAPALLATLYYKRRDSIDQLITDTVSMVLEKVNELKMIKM